MNKIKVIKSPDSIKPYAVIYKPKGLASAPLTSDDKDNALSQTINLFPEIKNIKGKKEIEYGLLHRLDTPTDGLLIIAASQDFYDFMLKLQNEDRFYKYYTALCDYIPENPEQLGNFPPPPADTKKLESYFRSFGLGQKEVRPVTQESNPAALKKIGKKKLYTTEIVRTQKKKDKYLIECRITQGFRHQVRCHLAWAGYPICGDQIYNSDKKNAEKPLNFSATKIEFEYPIGDLNSYEITFTWT